MHYFTRKLELVSDILWVIVAFSSEFLPESDQIWHCKEMATITKLIYSFFNLNFYLLGAIYLVQFIEVEKSTSKQMKSGNPTDPTIE